MAFTARTYGNRKAELNDDGEKIPNMASITMSKEELEAIAKGNKDALKGLVSAAKEATAE